MDLNCSFYKLLVATVVWTQVWKVAASTTLHHKIKVGRSQILNKAAAAAGDYYGGKGKCLRHCLLT